MDELRNLQRLPDRGNRQPVIPGFLQACRGKFFLTPQAHSNLDEKQFVIGDELVEVQRLLDLFVEELTKTNEFLRAMKGVAGKGNGEVSRPEVQNAVVVASVETPDVLVESSATDRFYARRSRIGRLQQSCGADSSHSGNSSRRRALQKITPAKVILHKAFGLVPPQQAKTRLAGDPLPAAKVSGCGCRLRA